MFTVAEYPALSRSAADVAGLLAEYVAFDRLRSWRRDLFKVGVTMTVLAMIAAAFERMSVPECWALAGLLLPPPLVVWAIEWRRWRSLARRLNTAAVQAIRKS
jgi:hypothetical protein